MKELLLLVDGSSYLFRAFHALPPLSTSDGQPTGAIHGVLAMLRRLIKDYQPAYMAVVFDPKGKTVRDDIFPAYKANRPPMPEELGCQIEPLHAIIRAMGVPLLVVPGVEADDVIGTLAARASKEGLDTVISTGDKDLAQLVDAHVKLVNTMNGSELTPESVKAKFGVKPEQIIDYLALVGDSVDNIPGVPKVGPKTAAKWLEQYQTLDGVVGHAVEVSGKVGENLRNCLEQLPLAKRLVTIDREVTLDRGPRDLQPAPPDRSALRDWYQRLQFSTWLNDLMAEESAPQPEVKVGGPDYETLLTQADFDRWLARLRQARLMAFDTETTSLDYMNAELVGVSFSLEAGRGAYVPFGHDYPGAPAQLARGSVLAALTPILEDAAVEKLGHNLKYDMSVLANHGIALRGVSFDSMLESYVLDSTATRHDMDSLALKYLGVKTIHYEDVAGKGARQITFDQVPIEDAGPYAAEDADISLRLHQVLWPRIAEAPSLAALLKNIEIPLIGVLSRIERNGVGIDAAMLHAQSREIEQRLRILEQEAYDIAGQPFNLGSPKQIQFVLFEKHGLPVRAKTPKGQPSTAESVLQELALDYPLPKLILEHRGLAKLKSTYTDALPEQINPKTGRVHTSYHQAVAATGRLSSSDPNLQNIPVRTEDGRRIRKAFVAARGHQLIAADYSQIELRIMAHLSQDEGLLRAFATGTDIHRATAAEVFGAGVEQVSEEQRRAAKAINFGLIYGMSAFGLARQLGIDRRSAQDYVDRYFNRYPGVKHYMEETRAAARKQGYVDTLLGRRLYVPEINSRNTQRRQYAERTAINAPMQGTAADIIKRAMIDIDQWINRSRRPVKMIMQVHDELVFEVAASELDNARQAIVAIMSGAASLRVPLVVDAGVGANWEEAH